METKQTELEPAEISGTYNGERSFENLTHRGHTESKRDIGKERVTYLTSLCKWMKK